VAVETVGYTDGAVMLLDQTLLPGEERVLRIQRLEDLCEAIRSLRVRGAPAIGVAAAYGFRMQADAWARDGGSDLEDLRRHLRRTAAALGSTRPTARNLFVAIERLTAVVEAAQPDAATLVARVGSAATAMHDEDRALCAAIARHGAALLPSEARVITHCNAGALATGGMGTALGIVYEAVRQGKSVHVYADETRPLLQGARLTTWELRRARVPVTLLCDNAAASLLARGDVHCAIVGADRIARNGDTANKVGTLPLALAAQRYGVPFYVAAPSTTIDLSLATGAEIPIEQRDAAEVAHGFGVATAPEDVPVYNPAFDVTPGDLVAAIVHEHGIVRPPYERTLAASLGDRRGA
jgi:methylthioribose-1-phosphate isomerase